MPRLLPRAATAGCALLLTALGPASSTRAAGAAVPADAQSARRQPSSDSSPSSVVLIPCISGMCQVPLHGDAALVPLKPVRPSPSGQPMPYTLAAVRRDP